ncbi:hypothetical protein BGW36DRAFT_41532 [Talaromyces proteolyticus]|uniref:Zn(2)-C6 fungal-type domain-containing protein n=1 Tax=Talaromyces proteolyticus TaxID=1131652 RepID=A0AAD4KIV8_9EURO|nr:uncharacterized protein BGW36DRAFT_41532 [Talaromyces proteolyticus]KAH8692094.1 hypothetical protein BGW36DRAFT_41532 [Talaromyces proteolyticus]
MTEPNIARSLAPAPPGYQRRSSSETVKPRKNISTACKACKTRKWKCSGTVPCSNCVRSNTECIIDESNDNRRRMAVKRKMAELEDHKNTLDRLVEALRLSTNEHFMQLLDLIRYKKAPLETVKTYLDRNVSDSEFEASPELQAIHNEIEMRTRPRSSRRILDVTWLSHIPVVDVPAAPWTTVTDDDGLVSYLISLWLTWSHPFCNWIDRDLFIRDMKSKNASSKYCSPFLVNSILAEACHYSDYPEVFKDPNDPNSKGMHFYKEAKRLLDKEEGRVNITSLQGCTTLLASMAIMGKDRVAWLYLGQIARMAAEISASLPPKSPHGNEKLLDEARSIDNTLWGVYNITAMYSTAFMKPLDLKVPLRPRFPCHHRYDGMVWEPYPRRTEKQASHLGCVLNSLASLNAINIETTRRILKDEARKLMSRAEIEIVADSIYPRLQSWFIDLPPCIQEGQSSLPHILLLHMYYHSTIMVLFGFLKHPLKRPEQARIISPEHAREACIESALQIAQMIRSHRTKWGIEYISATAVYWVAVALFTLLDDLDNPNSRDAFIDLCFVARVFSRRWLVAKGILRMLQITANQMNIDFPVETDVLLDDFETNIWEAEKDGRRFSSAYPNLMLFLEGVPGFGSGMGNSIDMDELLAKWDGVKLENARQFEVIAGRGPPAEATHPPPNFHVYG